MIKPDHWIKKFGAAGNIQPFNIEHVNPGGYEVTLGDTWIEILQGGLENDFKSNGYLLAPNSGILATTQEYIKLNNSVAAEFKLKSSLARKFLNHTVALYVNPGFEGKLTLEILNQGKDPFMLTKGMKIGQIVFMGLSEPCDNPYGSKSTDKYQGQQTTLGSKSTITQLDVQKTMDTLLGCRDIKDLSNDIEFTDDNS